MIGSIPGPSDFIASNFIAKLYSDKCNGCKKCVKRCQFDAITVIDKMASVQSKRCVGCGLCVSTCKTKALKLEKKETVHIPPENHEETLEEIMKNKKSKPVNFVKTAYAIWNSGR